MTDAYMGIGGIPQLLSTDENTKIFVSKNSYGGATDLRDEKSISFTGRTFVSLKLSSFIHSSSPAIGRSSLSLEDASSHPHVDLGGRLRFGH